MSNFVHIISSHKREDLPEYNQDAPCPICGGATESGFGLAAGGYGPYTYCTNCETVTSKSEVEE